MKKYLPLILFVLGIIVVGLVFFFINRSNKKSQAPDEEAAPEIALADRPVASLTPTADGHWLKLTIDKIEISAKSLDYELLYTLPDGRTQGVPGSITLKGESSIVRDLLLGSESSGKFRYDEGVREGTLTLKFRNDMGKLVAKFTTKFHLQNDTDEITSVDGKFSLSLSKTPAKTFFVTMETFGIPEEPSSAPTAGPWGVFTSSKTQLMGKVETGTPKAHVWTGSKWTDVTDTSSQLGIFVGTD